MASQWVAKRKLFYGIFSIVALVLVIGVPLFFVLHKTPTCDDGKKNQNEKGIDCGGACARLCPSDIVNPIVLWQRSFVVTPGVYNVVAYVQNPNVLAKVDKVGYVFRLYDSDNVQIGERAGTTFIPANQTFAIFEAGIRTGGRVSARASFSFTDTFVWSQNETTYKPPLILTNSISLTGESLLPRMDVVLQNKSLQTVANLEAVAIIYDVESNAIAASRTVVQELISGASMPITFTWPTPFSVAVARKEILLRIYPTGTAF